MPPATAAAAPVALAIDRRAVRASAAARTAAALAAASTGARPGLPAAALLGDQVLRDLGLVEVLVVDDRAEVGR